MTPDQCPQCGRPVIDRSARRGALPKQITFSCNHTMEFVNGEWVEGMPAYFPEPTRCKDIQMRRLIREAELIIGDEECPCCRTSNHRPSPEEKAWLEKAKEVR